MEDYKLVVITFPSLAAGDSVTYQVEFHQIVPEFKGYFDLQKTFSRAMVNDAAEIVIDAPKEMPLHTDFAMMSALPVEDSATRRVYRWTYKNSRYVATYIGAGGWVPHEAQWTLTHRYGDCKDHVTLLAALLAVKGIESDPVLINADLASFTLPKVPVRAFNHAITYLPRWQLYLDSTDNLATFGVLPEADSGRPVLHAGRGLRRQRLGRLHRQWQ
jgi:hypothetical protein